MEDKESEDDLDRATLVRAFRKVVLDLKSISETAERQATQARAILTRLEMGLSAFEDIE
jgi:hypothetical protein